MTQQAGYVDSHCHLDDEAFDQNRQEIVNGFNAAGIEFAINNSSDLNSSKASLALAQTYDKIFCAVGCHPHDAKTFDANLVDFVEKAAQFNKTVAVGEIGLDYHYDLSDRLTQRRVFAEQLRLADSLGLPVTIHTREAWGDTLKILADGAKYVNNGILFHCFNGSKETAELLTKKYDAYFAFGGVITFKNFAGADVVSGIPADRILTETDCPYMTPVPYRGKINQPAYVAFVAQKLAEIRQTDLPVLLNKVKENTLRLFKKIKSK